MKGRTQRRFDTAHHVGNHKHRLTYTCCPATISAHGRERLLLKAESDVVPGTSYKHQSPW